LNKEKYQFEKAFGHHQPISFINKTRLTHIYIKNGFLNIQISIFYLRGTFYWIGADDKLDYPKKWFGDTARAMNLLVTYRFLFSRHFYIL
jgi:hypothetical protein